MIEGINFEKMNGIVPAIIQDANDGAVLMVGFMNREALQRTLNDQQVVFWSRSKKRLWKKGETSGHFLNVDSIHTDCDSDALLIIARPSGPVCHTGDRSCFSSAGVSGPRILSRLAHVIAERKRAMPSGSYTAKLFSTGTARIAQKVGEEAVELVIASQHSDKKRIVEESADLLYHLLVLLTDRGISLDDVCKELEDRSQ